MRSHPATTSPPLVIQPGWRKVPTILIVVGGVLGLIGVALPGLRQQFAFSYLLAFMFFLSFCLGGLFLVIIHHLFDAGWSVPIRRINEHIACLLPVMAVLFLPIALLAKQIYPWMSVNPATDHALKAKLPLFTQPMFYVMAAACFGIWTLLTFKLRYWSLQQDKTGAAQCTYKMRAYSFWGVWAFALTLTTAAVMWMKGLEHEWFSTMYGVYYFASSVWMTLAAVYLITMILWRLGPLRDVVHERQFYFLGSIMFAFTVFYAYIHFSQYFIIWNANMPEETFWYLKREAGSWWSIGMLIIFGHFFVPFLALIRIDMKLKFWWMVPVCLWAWLMHFCDMSFNIMPAVIHKDGFVLHWLDLACLAFIGGVLAKVFLKYYQAHPPYPQKDPRFAEALGISHPVPTAISGGDLDEIDEVPDARPE